MRVSVRFRGACWHGGTYPIARAVRYEGLSREEADTRGERHAIFYAGGSEEINERVEELADEKGVTIAQIPLV